MNSSRIVIAAPMSFTGSWQRTHNVITSITNPGVRYGVVLPGMLIVLMLWWIAIGSWYAVFGLLLVPYRLIRRGSRKRKLEDRRHQEILRTLEERDR